MQQTKSLRNAKAAVAAAAIMILVGSSVAYASDAQKAKTAFHSGYEFQVYDPSEPVVDTSVNGTFIDHDIIIHVNMSAHDGVKVLKGSYTIGVSIWNDTTSSYQPFSTLVSGKTIALTATPTPLEFTFNTTVAGTYSVDVDFNATSVVLA
jgi:hypothetical protein